jgi:AcrR family transcriptional regulator
VAEIAEWAGLTKSTFFRHFTDKQEVLFWGQDALIRLFVDAITGAPSSATPIDAVLAALDAAATVFSPERRAWAQQRQAVIAGNSDLRERELLKRATLAEAMADALRKRGVTDPTASLAAEFGSLAFRNAFARWTDPTNQRDFADVARRELDGLRAATAALDSLD